MVSDLLTDGYALQGTDGALVNMYTDKISQTVSIVQHTHDLGDTGTCACGYESKTAVSGNKQGVFGVVKDGQVSNFKISGTITIDGVYTHIGGVVGNAKGGAVISDITSGVKISGSGAAKHIGGMVGSSEENWKGSLTVERCIFSGTINLPNVSDCVGGVMGYANDFVSILYCGFNGSVTGKKDGYIGGILGYINNEISEVLKTRLRRAKQMERRLSGRSEIAATV